ncbi:hypothetical protein MXD61_25355 [Frankia sp. AgPm24]|uniref:hypothetical protein n=1 Tax=Frankia sp. AgPm24 TaxID=631128 RepID=UPI00200BAFA7|nr:hypothetical protein [Frankia sp. AgPm24]MCK9925157.1 hypothetical protein [Frankia sp. AgPm24]
MTDDALAALGLARPTGDRWAVPNRTYAYLVQVSADGTRWNADWTEPSGGFEPDTAASNATEVARRVLQRRFLQIRADGDPHRHRMWFRIDVWSLDTAAPRNGHDPSTRSVDLAAIALSGRHLLSRGVPPDAVEIRTPAQVRHEIDGDPTPLRTPH